MPIPYFAKFPKIAYDIDGDGSNIRIVVDIIHWANFLEVVRSNAFIYLPYNVKEGETPEIIAGKLYGSEGYFWIVMFANKMFDRWADWPLDYYQFTNYLTKKYGSMEAAQTTIHHYEDTLGNVVDPSLNSTWDDESQTWDQSLETWDADINGGVVLPILVYDYETSLNEAKKKIQLIDPQYIAIIDTQMNNLMIAAT